MSAPAITAATAASRPRHLVQVTALAWLTVIGFDLLMNAGILSHFYDWRLPGFIPPMKMFAYIPLGWAAFLLHLVLLAWLMVRTGTVGLRAGAKFGAQFGGFVGAAALLGTISIFSFPLRMHFCWALFTALTFTLGGAVIGSGLAAPRMRGYRIRVIAVFLLFVVAGVAAQIIMPPPPGAAMNRGRISIGWDANK